jgi:hypothetical protein
MVKLWLLRGRPAAAGWLPLETDARSGALDVVLFDRDRWALCRAADPPTAYEGLTAEEPPDGLYLDGQGRPLHLLGGQIVPSARPIVAALGADAEALLAKIGDADLVLERLGKVY